MMSEGAGVWGPHLRRGRYVVVERREPHGRSIQRSFDAFDEAESYRAERARAMGKVVIKRTAQTRTPAALRTVYFIQAETGGPIKIGSAVNVDERVAELQQGHPDRFVILATARGGEGKERAWHKQFAAARKRGEWFHPVPGLIILIGELRSQAQPVADSAVGKTS